MSGWEQLADVLARRTTPLRLWWRDDDAGRPHPALDDMLSLAQRTGTPLALAIVPDWLEPSVTRAARDCALVSVLQHGIAHADHARAGDKRIELGGEAPRDALDRGLVRGRERLAEAFGDRFAAILAPPWNRIADDVVAKLPALGFLGLSCFGHPPSRPTAGLLRIDTHLDLQDWRQDGVFAGSQTLLERFIALVREATPATPIGILTHHQRMDRAAFDWLERLLTRLSGHRIARILPASELFGEVA